MWLSAITAALFCLALGLAINATTGAFPQKKQELLEGIVAVIAIDVLTFIVLWMRKMSRSVKQPDGNGGEPDIGTIPASGMGADQRGVFCCGA